MADLKISQLTGATTPLAGTEVLPIVQSSATVKVSVDNLIAGRALPNLGIGVAPSSWGPLQKAIEYGVVGAGISVNNTNGNMNIASNQYNNGTSTLYASTNPNFLVQFSRSVGALNLYTALSGTIGTAVTNTLQYQFGNTGDFTLNTGNLVIGTSGKGIDFSATSHPAGMTSELLSDYEEGTWTPSQGAGLTVIGAFGSSGTYTKIGRQVTIVGTITGATSIACASGNVFVGNFPYNVGTYGAGSAFNAALNASTVLGSDGGSNMYSTTVIGATTRISFAFTYFV
jgi:hypothetical protein